MADSSIDIEIELDGSKAVSKAKKAGQDIGKTVDNGIKNAGKSADSVEKNIEKPLKNAAKSAKSSFADVASAAKSSFSDVGDAAKTAAGDASSAFESVPSDAKGAFADVSSEAQTGFSGVSDAAGSAAGDASSAFEGIPADAAGSFSDVSSEAQNGFSGVADAAQSVSSDAASAFDGIQDAARQAGDDVNEAFSVKTVAAGNIAADAVGALASKLGEIGQNAIDAGTQFDKSMSQVAATMGITTDEIGDLTNFAKEMGAATAFSASQASEALNYMALAGYDAETSMSMLPTVLNLAAAGDMELATASDMVTDAQSALGLSLEETSEMVDKMAKASSKSNTSVAQLGSAFLTVGGTAKNLKGGTTELATSLGILADNGIKGSEGGTALRNVILSLSAPTDKAAEALADLGVEAFDSQGNLRSLDDIFKDMNGTLSTMTQGEQTQVLNTIFNKVDLKSVNALLANTTNSIGDVASALRDTSVDVERFGTEASASGDNVIELGKAVSKAFTESNGDVEKAIEMLQEEYIVSYDEAREMVEATSAVMQRSGSRFKELSGYIDQAAGSAQKMADTQLDNLAGDMTLLESATEGLYIAISDKLSPYMREMTQFATNKVMPALMDIVENFDEISPKILAAVAALATMKAKTAIVDQFTSATGLASRAASNLGRDFATMTTRQKASAIATNSLRGALNGLGKAMPLVAVAALAEVITLVAEEMKKADEKAKKLETATSGLEKAASGLTVEIDEETGAIKNLSDAASNVDLDELTQQHIDLAKAINDTNQSASTGQASLSGYNSSIQELAGRSDLTEEDVARLKVAVDGVNEACGTSYTVAQDAGGAYQVMSDGAVVAKESIYDLIEAQKAQLRAESEAENYKAVYEQMAKDQDALTEATKNATAAEEALTEKLKSLGDARYGVNQATGETIDFAAEEQAAYDKTRQALDEVEAQAGATQSSMNKLSEQQVLTAMASDQSASALIKAADANLKFRSGVQGADVDLVAFSKALETMGFTSEQVADMSSADAMKLARAWESGYDDMKKASEDATGAIPEALANMGEDAYNEAYGVGDSAGQGFRDGLTDEQQAAVDAALETVELTDDELAKLNDLAKTDGADAVLNYALSIQNGRNASGNAGKANASEANKGFLKADGQGAGDKMVRDYQSSINNGQGESRASGEANANAAGEGFRSQNDESGSWGEHLTGNFAEGIRQKTRAVRDAVSSVADVVKSILGHTVPKEGVLREGGKGEAKWGEHLVQNIADGMMSRKARSAIRGASREVAVDINDTLLSEMSRIDPFAQLEESITKGAAAFNLSAMVSGAAPTYTTNSQTLNFNHSVRSPDEIARTMRMQQRYGLAGQNI